jgi:hypothetical protein
VVDNDHHFECMQEVLESVNQAQLNQSFHAWMQRFNKQAKTMETTSDDK